LAERGRSGDRPALSWEEQADLVKVPGIKSDVKPPPERKIAILGTCPSRVMAPVDDITWEIWTIGPGGKNTSRWERLFEVHGAESWPPGFKDYIDELRKVKSPQIIYTEMPVPIWPANQVINKDALFHKYGRMWFQSQISYALAIALEEGVTHLGIFGIDLEAGEEYRSQYTSAKHFMEIARLAGIDIVLPSGCGLLRDVNPYPDAWETHLARTLKAKIDYLQGMMNQKQMQASQLGAEINGLQGEIGAFQFIQSLYVVSGVDPATPTPNTDATISDKMDEILFFLKGPEDGSGSPPSV
jgi:hypothetical protein